MLIMSMLTDADVPHQRTGKPHTNTVIDIETIYDDVVEVLPLDAVLLEAQLRLIHQEEFILGMVRSEFFYSALYINFINMSNF
jgi:hypothetical protein